jgi:hypothetical protein
VIRKSQKVQIFWDGRCISFGFLSSEARAAAASLLPLPPWGAIVEALMLPGFRLTAQDIREVFG